MNIYLYSSGTQHELRNLYIGEYKGREPGENTTMYFKFNNSLKDEITGTTYSASGITYTDLPSGGNKCAVMPGNSNGRFQISNNISGGGSEITMHVWFQVASISTRYRCEFSGKGNNFNYFTSFIVRNGNIELYYYDNSTSITGTTTIGANTRHLFSVTEKAGGKVRIYLDGRLEAEANMQSSLIGSSDVDGYQYVGANRFGNTDYRNGKLSEMIGEKIERTADKILDYYNDTKYLYGIS